VGAHDEARLTRCDACVRCRQVRMMLPMSIRCNTCGNYIYKGARAHSVASALLQRTRTSSQLHVP
jgi:PHP family Zn ribbon phosphoesterase